MPVKSMINTGSEAQDLGSNSNEKEFRRLGLEVPCRDGEATHRRGYRCVIGGST